MATAKTRARTATASATPIESTTDAELRDEYDFIVRWSDTERSFVAEVSDWPGVRAFAPTREAALQRAEHMLQLAIETHRDRGWEPPRPAPIAEGTGQFRLRLPRQLHAQLAALAARNGVSLNQFVVSLLAEATGRTEEIDRAVPSIQSAAIGVLDRVLPAAHAALAETVRRTLQESLDPHARERVAVAHPTPFFDSPSEYVRVRNAMAHGLGLAVARGVLGRYEVPRPVAPAEGAANISIGTDPSAASAGSGEEG